MNNIMIVLEAAFTIAIVSLILTHKTGAVSVIGNSGQTYINAVRGLQGRTGGY